ncbi:unnamed protein product [Mycena citricolor]|uniref:Uncharacterized protein n=1 Tax=Mycena citricolor TaxID=2018698 RepID=A0AAD2H2D4_9AGAR|nr:unnamed protein product [Mycena citricolor]
MNVLEDHPELQKMLMEGLSAELKKAKTEIALLKDQQESLKARSSSTPSFQDPSHVGIDANESSNLRLDAEQGRSLRAVRTLVLIKVRKLMAALEQQIEDKYAHIRKRETELKEREDANEERHTQLSLRHQSLREEIDSQRSGPIPLSDPEVRQRACTECEVLRTVNQSSSSSFRASDPLKKLRDFHSRVSNEESDERLIRSGGSDVRALQEQLCQLQAERRHRERGFEGLAAELVTAKEDYRLHQNLLIQACNTETTNLRTANQILNSEIIQLQKDGGNRDAKIWDLESKLVTAVYARPIKQEEDEIKGLKEVFCFLELCTHLIHYKKLAIATSNERMSIIKLNSHKKKYQELTMNLTEKRNEVTMLQRQIHDLEKSARRHQESSKTKEKQLTAEKNALQGQIRELQDAEISRMMRRSASHSEEWRATENFARLQATYNSVVAEKDSILAELQKWRSQKTPAAASDLPRAVASSDLEVRKTAEKMIEDTRNYKAQLHAWQLKAKKLQKQRDGLHRKLWDFENVEQNKQWDNHEDEEDQDYDGDDIDEEMLSWDERFSYIDFMDDTFDEPVDRAQFKEFEPIHDIDSEKPYDSFIHEVPRRVPSLHLPKRSVWTSKAQVHALAFAPTEKYNFQMNTWSPYTALQDRENQHFNLFMNKGEHVYYAGEYIVHSLREAHEPGSEVPWDISQAAIMRDMGLRSGQKNIVRNKFGTPFPPTECFGLQCVGFDHGLYMDLRAVYEAKRALSSTL